MHARIVRVFLRSSAENRAAARGTGLALPGCMDARQFTQTATLPIVLAVALVVAGCATTGAEPWAVAASVPSDAVTYPQTRHDGREVFLIDNRWYFRSGSVWFYYRQEPVDLYEERLAIYREKPYAKPDELLYQRPPPGPEYGSYFLPPPLPHPPLEPAFHETPFAIR